ncbi:hypothetical protein JJQ59_34975 (plasmid) [Cupriavidus necator]|uniref:Uncharacterized protein n=1 Tax=Cupriavidus necator TaxID=106590 RepID=A0A367PSC0_CUPNE|nr:hypothetical protein [Cupriavidus necator]QQX89730.1 hypothetical protein JJQ59_34975 [Cupriavidus necator]RCJ10454.1 hypothetical protein DDK22_00365 [Cupriavidus necator]
MLANTIQAPSRVSITADELSEGIDLLGLRYSVQVIGSALLDGITTVTPSIRYLSLSLWLIYQYASEKRPDSAQAFSDYGKRAEAAVVMGNLLAHSSVPGLIGPITGKKRLAGDDEPTLAPLVQAAAVDIYQAAAERLHLMRLTGNVPQIVTERALPIVTAVRSRLERTCLPELLAALDGDADATVSREALRQLGEAFPMRHIPEDERHMLRNALLPEAPRTSEQPRIATYACLLRLAELLKRVPTNEEFLAAACAAERFAAPSLDTISDGWLLYCIRDVIAAAHERVMELVTYALRDLKNRNLLATPASVLGELLRSTPDVVRGLTAVGLARDGESLDLMTMRELAKRVGELTGMDRRSANGLNRWAGGFHEEAVQDVLKTSDVGALALLPVAWLLVAQRVDGLDEAIAYQVLARDEAMRIGIFQTVIPTCQRWLREDQTLIAAIGELMERTVYQHVSIAWSRMQTDPTKNLALLSEDEGRWRFHGRLFPAGRTGSRIKEAIGWLEQLGLIDEDGLTEEGEKVLHRISAQIAGGAE